MNYFYSKYLQYLSDQGRIEIIIVFFFQKNKTHLVQIYYLKIYR